MNFIKSRINIVFLIMVVLFAGAIIYSTSKAGFGFSKKTFMDWIELLVIPVSLAIFAFFTNKYEKEREGKKAIDQQQEDALQNYIDKVTDILRESENLRQEDLNAIKIRTLTVLRRLDAKRKADVVKFLFESKLICNKMITQRVGNGIRYNPDETSPLSLKDADLRDVDLSGSFFQLREYTNDCEIVWKINLAEADLSNANLEGATFLGADLHGAKLYNANLKEFDGHWANFTNVNFESATLIRARINTADMAGTNFKKANCKNCSFDGSTFFSVTSDGKITGVDFTDANLTNASFSWARIFPDHLKRASLWKTRLPNGRLYAHLHPLFSINLTANQPGPPYEENPDIIESGMCGCKQNISIDKKGVIENKTVTRGGVRSKPDQNTVILEALWEKYDRHSLRAISKNPFKMILYIIWEFDANYVVGAKSFGQFNYRIESGLRFWKHYKKNCKDQEQYE